MSQMDRIARHLRSGKSLTALSALRMFDCFRLAARVKQLKNKGLPIVSETVRLRRGKRIARYSLA